MEERLRRSLPQWPWNCTGPCGHIFTGGKLEKVQMVENPLTSYRIYPRNIQNVRSPEIPLQIPPEYPKNTKILFSGYFPGIFGVFFRSPAVGEIRMSSWYFWPILGFVGFSALYLVAQIARCNRDVRCDSNRTPPNR